MDKIFKETDYFYVTLNFEYFLFSSPHSQIKKFRLEYFIHTNPLLEALIVGTHFPTYFHSDFFQFEQCTNGYFDMKGRHHSRMVV